MPTRNWTGGANGGTANHPVSGVWSTALNWDTAPVAGDTVQFGGNPSAFAYTVTLDINAAITRVTFNSNSALATLAVGTHTLTVTGSGANIISMNANAEITLLGGTVDLTAADGGIQTAIGSIIAGEGTITAGSTTNGGISGGGAIIASGGVLDLQSRLTGTTTLTVGGGASDTLKLERASTATSASFNGSTGKLEVGTAGTLTLTSALAIGSGNTVALDGAGTTQLTDNNGVSLTGGTLSGTGSVAANTNISGVGTVAINISNAGTITANGGTLDLTGTVSGRTLAISTTDGSDLKIDGTATSAAITINNAAQTLEVGATGALTISTAESITNGKIQLDGGTLTDAAGLTVGTLATLTGSGTVAANIGAGTGTITASNGVLNLTGSVTSGPSFAIGTASASTLLFSGTATASNPISINDSHQTLEIGSAGNLTINGAESITNGTVKLDGGTLRDSIGTTEQTFTVGSGGTLTGFGNAPNTIILAGGTVAQSSGGVLKTVSITGFGTVNGVTGTTSPVTGATQIVASGGLLDLIGTVGGSQLVVDPNKASSVLKVDGNVTAGGSDWIDLHSANQTVEVGTAGNLTLSFLETVSNGTIKLDGGTLNANGGVLGTLTKNNGVPGIGVTLIGKGVVNGTISGSGVVEGQAGVLTVSNNVTSSTILLEADSVASSVLALDGTVASGISFDYLNTGGVFSGGLLLGNSTARTSFETGGTIAGMHVGGSATATTDFIDIAGVVPTSFTSGVIVGSTIELFNGANEVDHFNLASAPGANAFVDWQTDGSGGTDVFLSTVTCFVTGTRILTVTGERTVESLMQGDIVLTLADGELVAQPVRWVGQRRIDLTAHPRPATVAPVRIRRGAFGDNMPHADLLVSPDHAVFVDGKLICARQLINGATICAEKGWTAVEYFHVELDTHAILLAEGLPSESYLDTGNRGFFANGGEPLVLHPDLTDEADYPAREAGSCAPFVSDEASVRPVWQRLAERAAALGQPAPRLATTDDPELRIVAKGRTVRPLYGENGLYIFALPKGATEVRLVSRAGSPTDARPWLDDRRCLGVDVERIVLRGANELREVPVDHPGLSQGWHAVERDGVALRRWTNGDAVLPLPVLGGPTMLEIRAGGGGMAYVTVADVGEQRAA